jgi:MoaA/NifB/PqqE/SkfB family radical SAM enzyme
MRKEQLQRYKQYFLTYFRRITFQKTINLLKTEFRLFQNNHDLKGLLPYFLFVEISNKCNLSCPLCQMGQRQTISRTSAMNLENYKKLIIPLKNYLFQIFLYDWGEPFLNKDIYDIISVNTRLNIATVVSTNFNLPFNPVRLIESGLEHLIISGDGVTQEVYGSYRKDGMVTTVFKNLESLVKIKREKKSKFPFIEWQCLVTKYNESHLENIKKTALEKGVDYVRFANLNFYSTDGSKDIQQEWLPENPRYRAFETEKNLEKLKRGIRRPCFWLWRGPVVNVNGGVTPCCLYDVPDWGNAIQNNLQSVWNNEFFMEARKRSQNNPALKTREIICDQCKAPFVYK